MGFRRDEELRGSAARKALPPVVRDFYDVRTNWGGSRDAAAPKDAFLGLECRVCGRLKNVGHRPSCPVPKAERALAKAAAMRKPKEKETTHARG